MVMDSWWTGKKEGQCANVVSLSHPCESSVGPHTFATSPRPGVRINTMNNHAEFVQDFQELALAPCKNCGRTFNPETLLKHEKICKKTASQRKVFESSKQVKWSNDMISSIGLDAVGRFRNVLGYVLYFSVQLADDLPEVLVFKVDRSSNLCQSHTKIAIGDNSMKSSCRLLGKCDFGLCYIYNTLLFCIRIFLVWMCPFMMYFPLLIIWFM